MRASPAEFRYPELRRAVRAAGLQRRAYGYYAALATGCAALLILSLLMVFALPPLLGWRIAATLLLSVAIVQVALIGHDAGHLAIFEHRGRNQCLGQISWTLVAGVGFWYWNARHNLHHARTNDIECDPDLCPSVLNRLTRHSGLAIALLSIFLSSVMFRIESWLYAIARLRGSQRWLELALLSANIGFWCGLILRLGWSGVWVFLGVQCLSSLYLTALVAPNHRGLPGCTAATRTSFIEQQILSSRNLASGTLWDLLYGGLNSQIEHHLFPTMPRPHLRHARGMVRAYCRAVDLPYREVSPVAAYREVIADALRGTSATQIHQGTGL